MPPTTNRPDVTPSWLTSVPGVVVSWASSSAAPGVVRADDAVTGAILVAAWLTGEPPTVSR